MQETSDKEDDVTTLSNARDVPQGGAEVEVEFLEDGADGMDSLKDTIAEPVCTMAMHGFCSAPSLVSCAQPLATTGAFRPCT